ncbi:transglutaminaseTgpA domain-containing protein, partial [Aciditerrimonas ferrireducens]
TRPLRLALAALAGLAGALGTAGLAGALPGRGGPLRTGAPGCPGPVLAGLVPSTVLLGAGAGLTSGRDLGALVAWVVLAASTLGLCCRTRTLAALGPLTLATLVTAAVALAPVAGHRLTTSAPGHGSGSSLVVGQPTADLRAEKLRLTNLLAFRVTARFPTYWQLTTLASFTGSAWVPGPTIAPPASARGRRAATLGRTRLVQEVQLVHLQSPWLPAAATPASVRGPHATVQGAQGDVVANGPDPRRYEVVSLVETAPASVLARLAEPSPLPGWLRPALSLPAVPASVVALAHRLVAGLQSPFDEAVALVDYLTSARFRYTLDPPPAPRGANPLAAFLFDTRAGYCQQFASAFGVLARLDGLPTVLAVGFTAGRQTSPGHFAVTAADAHVWPEVYLGSAGWVAFEPTPPAVSGSGAAGSAARGVAAPTGVGS